MRESHRSKQSQVASVSENSSWEPPPGFHHGDYGVLLCQESHLGHFARKLQNLDQ